MAGSVLAPLSVSPASPQQVVANYSIDSFSEYSTRTVNRASWSPTAKTSGSRSARAKEEDEELFRDLFTGDNDEISERTEPTSRAFIPQKPLAQRTQPSTGNFNPRKHLAPMKPLPPQPAISKPLIPRLRLEELVNARPEDDDDISTRRSSRRKSDLEQVTEEDESSLDEWQNDIEEKYQSSSFQRNSLRSNNDKELEQETMRFLEKMELKAVLHTPRPDILTFYPNLATTLALSPHSNRNKVVGNYPEENQTTNEPPKPKTDDISSRLAYMEIMYGTTPSAPRKTRRETINRLANPISGHSSTLQALSPRQREKREAALTSRVPTSPLAAVLALSSRRGVAAKKTGPAALLDDFTLKNKTSTRRTTKRPDPLLQKHRTTSASISKTTSRGIAISGLNARKGKASIMTRKEALKKKLQGRSGPQRIGGSTFLTQRDDEEGVELIDNFIKRNRGAAQASLTFRSTKPTLSRRVTSKVPISRPQPPQIRPGNSLNKNSGRSRAACVESLSERRGQDSGLATISHQPRRPQAWPQATSNAEQETTMTNTRSFTRRRVDSNGSTAANPIRKLKAHPAMPVAMSYAPKAPPSAASTLLMGPTPLLLGGGKSVHASRQVKTKASKRKAKEQSLSTNKTPGFEAPTKVSVQRTRTLNVTTSHAPAAWRPLQRPTSRPAPRREFAGTR